MEDQSNTVDKRNDVDTYVTLPPLLRELKEAIRVILWENAEARLSAINANNLFSN